MADSTLQEHHWFTATTVVMNGFLLNGMQAVSYPCLLKLLATVVSAFAAYLVLERSAFAAKRNLVPPDDPEAKAATWRDKQRETVFKFKTVLRHVRFVFFEASGALFYLVLIAVSWLAVVLAHG